MLKKSFAVCLGVVFLLCVSSTVFASGFAIVEQSVSGLGVSFAGALSGDDPSTIFFNPASITLLGGQQATGGLHFIMPSTKFHAKTVTNAFGGTLGTDNGGDGGVNALVPNLYYSNKVNDKLSIGIGINAPFGLSTDYDRTWVGRYYAKESDVATVNLNPVVAYKVTDKLTLAAGVSAEYIDVTLSSMVDGGLVAFEGAAMNPSTPPATLGFLASQVSNTDLDVLVKNKAHDWDYGYNLGLMYEFSPKIRAGLAYRSEITHKLRGDVTSQVPAALTSLNPLLAGAFTTQDVNGSITLPATVSASLYSKVTDKLALMADVTWTGWSSFDKLTINFEGAGIAGQKSVTTTENWDDTWRYSLGASYQATDALKLRCGMAYDETPISDDYRTPRIPGEDRFWITVGSGYQFTEHFNMDFAYAHLFVSDSHMEKYATNPEDTASGTVVGKFENYVDIASIQFTYKF